MKEQSDARIGKMFAVDVRRMLTQKTFYIMTACSFVLPILIIVMTAMAGEGEMFTSVWQAIGSADGAMSMDLTGMCNINMVYFLAAVFACLFTADDFRSGACKNIFAVRAKKADYVFSKIAVSFITGALMLLFFFAGSMLAGRIAGLIFAMEGFAVWNLLLCMISKVLLMAIFAAIYVLMGVIAKRHSWMSILLSFMVGMFMFMVIPMMTPLDAGLINVVMCLAGAVIFTAVLGKAAQIVLERSDIL